MNHNMGGADRVARIVIASALLVVGILMGPIGWVPVILYAIAAVLVGTAVVSTCPLYMLLGLRTCPAPVPRSDRSFVRDHMV